MLTACNGSIAPGESLSCYRRILIPLPCRYPGPAPVPLPAPVFRPCYRPLPGKLRQRPQQSHGCGARSGSCSSKRPLGRSDILSRGNDLWMAAARSSKDAQAPLSDRHIPFRLFQVSIQRRSEDPVAGETALPAFYAFPVVRP